MPLARLQFKNAPLLLMALLLVLAASGYKMLASDAPLTSESRLVRIPPLVLWAWERPERLSYLDPDQVTVAFLAQTIYLSRDQVIVRPRLQPLEVPSKAPLIAVTRIESDRKSPPSLDEAQTIEAARKIASTASLPGVINIQIDYDAAVSERVFYRDLIGRVPEEIPPSTALTITALASWCEGDNWLDDLPIDEAVPMLFRMGSERNQFLAKLASGTPFRSRKCQMSAGISTDEPRPVLTQTRRLYVFSPTPWSKEAVANLTSQKP